MGDEDSLVVTRARRHNAGSRLKQLIALEEQSNEAQQSVSHLYTEDDENVNLLFQEDANDEEFVEEVEEEEEEEEEEREVSGDDGDDERQRKGENEEVQSNGGITSISENDEEEAQVDSDEQLSNSDISASDSDMSEGEKELQRQESVKKRKLKKKHGIVPAIKRAKTTEVQIKKPKSLVTSESLMLSARRASSRSSVVESKQALVEKLKRHEKKKAISTPIVRVKHVDLTQEEKLEEAIETEKANVISLNQFREQEIYKKEKQRQMFLSKRVKLQNVVRFLSQESYITPLDEVLGFRHMQQVLRKSKKRPGRKKKISDEPLFKRLPGELDTELPMVKEEIEKRRLEEALKLKEETNSDAAESHLMDDFNVNSNVDSVEADSPSIQSENSGGLNESNLDNNTDINLTISADSGIGATSTILDDCLENKKTDPENINSLDPNSKDRDIIASKHNRPDVKMEDSEPVDAVGVNKENLLKHKSSEEECCPVSKDSEKIENNEGIPIDNNQDIETVDGEKLEEKKVKFADELNEKDLEIDSEAPESVGATPLPEYNLLDEQFEGPAQRVARNNIFLFDFDEKHPVDISSIKSYLLGPQSLLPASRRFKDLRTIVRIGQVENPYAIVKNEKDELLTPASELDEDNPIFEKLRKLPKFGIAQTIVEEIEEDAKEETMAIVLKTEAPTGLYLPNGNKKNCLISGTEVKYFDPANGIPYSSVETYRLLKSIEQGSIPWYSLGEDNNDTGVVELYLGSRDGSRHAKGVPEGFDA